MASINPFLLLRKGVFPYEYMGQWEKLMKHYYQRKELHSHLNMEEISDADYTHTKLSL